MKKGLSAFLTAALLVSLSACGPGAIRLQRYEATFLTLFDTVTTVVGYAEHKEAFTADAQLVHDDLEVYHQLYDIYNDYDGVNNIKTINDSAGVAPVKVDQKIIDLLLECRRMYDVTGGKMNVAMGRVLSIWHTYREAGIDNPAHAALPPIAALKSAAEHMNFDDVVVDETASTVYLSDPDMRLDVGAIAKGYATQRVTDAARERGSTSLLISVGGNVCALGSQDGKGNPWKVGVQDPEDADNLLHTLGIADKTVVTSGSYQRYYTVDGEIYHHIIDPDTLMPANYFLAVTVLAEDSGTADALSTALFNLPYEDGLALINSVSGAAALWIAQDRTERFSPGFENYLMER